MASLLGRFRHVAESLLGLPLSSVAVEIRRQGATARAASGTANLAVTVEDVGGLVTGSVDTVEIWRGTTVVTSSLGSSTFSVVTVAGTTVTLGGFAGTLTIEDDDRLSPINNLPSLFMDAAGTESLASLPASGADGVSTCWLAGGYYDSKVSGSGLTSILLQDITVLAEKTGMTNQSSTEIDAVNSPKWIWDTVNANDLETGFAGNQMSILAQWRDQGSPIVTIHGLGNSMYMRVGGRAQTTGDSNTVLYVSEAFTADTDEEVAGIHTIHQISSNVLPGHECIAMQAEFQYNPSTAKAASADVMAVQGFGRATMTHAGASMTLLRGGLFKVLTTAGSVGSITNFRSLEVSAPLNSGTASITNALGLYCEGPLAGTGSSQNLVALFSSPADEAADVIFSRAPIRIHDEDNQANSATAGRWIDIFREWDGADANSGGLYAGVHLTMDLVSSFDSGDDGIGFRSVVRTQTASGDGTNLDVVAGFESVTQHRSNATVDEVYGVFSQPTMSGASGLVNTMSGFKATVNCSAGTVTTLSGLDVTLTTPVGTVTNAYGALLRSLTPSASFASVGHIRMVPVSLATPATTLASLTGEEEMLVCAVTDSNNAGNSGIYLYINGAWFGLTHAKLTAASFAATDV